MSFRCERCNKSFPSGEGPVKVVVKRRDKVYSNENGRNTTGWEIEKEIDICKSCANPPLVKK
jgi:hypothetical protein